jgi:hypothetical protein
VPRIGGGGGPFIPPQTTGAQQTNKGDFASKVKQAQGPTQATPAAQAQQAKKAQESRLSGHMRSIAKKLAKGDVDQKEATREFVGLVIEERFPNLKKKKKKKKGDDDEKKSPEEQLEEAVTELIAQDPSLAQRLETQFKKLAKA